MNRILFVYYILRHVNSDDTRLNFNKLRQSEHIRMWDLYAFMELNPRTLKRFKISAKDFQDLSDLCTLLD